MKHYLRFLITMLLLVLFGGGSFGQTWQKVELKDLTSDDVFVIVDVLNGYAISNAPVSKRPEAVQVALNEAGNELTSTTIAENLKWKVSSDKGVYVFTSNANSNNVLYWAGGTKTDIKIGNPTSDNKKNGYHKFVEATSSIYSGLKTQNATRYICNYSNEDWRCYEGGVKAGGSNLQNNKTKLAYFKYVNDTRTATKVTFGADEDGKPVDVTEGEESSFSGKIATEKDGVAGTIKYSSNNKDVVSVDETTGVVKFGKTFGTATITALFTPTDAAKYKESSASYTINYKEKERIATTLAFAETKGSVKLGETFTLPELTLKAGNETLTGKTYTYTSSAPEVASIENTGEVKILSAGNTVLTAEFVDPEKKYNKSSAEYTLKVIDPNTIVFSAADKSFENVGTYSNTESEIDCNFVSTSGEYTFRVLNCMTNTNNATPLYGCLQMSSSDSERGNGIVKSPSFDAFPNGYKVTVYYTKSSSSEYMTISSDKFSDVKSTSTQTGDECITTISLPSPFAKFTMTANKGAKYVSKIELTALAAPEIETVTLDETSDNISTVISDNAGRTVNVTLKRSISKDYLNTVCLPFAISADQVAEVFGEGSVVSDYTSVTGTVMNFTPVTEMVANHPYIVNATETFDTKNIAGVTLKTIAGNENKIEFENTEKTFLADFVGSPLIHEFTYTDGSELFLGKDGKLYRPNAKGDKMKGMRAYFEVVDYTGTEAKVNIGGGLSSIDKLMNGEAMTGKVYNLNGQYVGNTLDGLAKGLYIMNGKKYVVK